MAEVKSYKVLSLPSRPSPDSIYWVKGSSASDVIGYITDINGVPYPLKDLQGSGGITTLTNTDGNLVITGADNKVINIAPALLSVINSALQSGANISELVNDVGYITINSVPVKTSDLTNDGSDGTSTYVEADELGAVATSNDYNDLDNLPTIPTVPNFADQTETNAGVVSDKTIAPNTLAGWWTYVKGLAQTFSEKITFGKEIKLTPIATPTYEKGLVYFDDTNDCISFLDSISGTSVQVGYEVLMRARNNTGTTILNGSVVYISGAIGQNSTVALAQSNTLPTSEIIGIATHDIANNTVGKICVFGLVNDLNTSSFTDGQMLYLSATVAGGLTSTIPASPNFVVALGVVEHAHPTQGKILVRPQRALANNNTLGTAQNVPPTQNAVKTALDSKVDKVTTAGVERVYTINADGSQGTKPTSELAGSSDTYSYWFSYTASHVTSAILYTQVANAILATSGTQSLITRAGTNLYNSYHFLNWVSATANGSNAGVKINNNADVQYRAGVEAYIIFGNNSDNVNHVTAVGSYGLLSAVPNLDIANFTTDFVGVGNDPTDTNLSFYCKRQDAPASYIKVPTNSNFPAHTLASDVFMLKFETNRVSVQADFQIKLTLTNLINGAVISHTFIGLECPDLNKSFINTVNRSNRNTGVATAIRWIKTHIKAKYF